MTNSTKENSTGAAFKLMPLTKVLIALDYDNSAKKVAEKGFSLAKSMGAEVTLLHVIADPMYYSSLEASPILGFSSFESTAFSQIIDADGLKVASDYFLNKLKKHLGDDGIQIRTEDGDSSEGILKAAKHIHADVIVMGSHSKRWLEQILMGSVTEKVLHNTTIPMFIIPIKKT